MKHIFMPGPRGYWAHLGSSIFVLSSCTDWAHLGGGAPPEPAANSW